MRALEGAVALLLFAALLDLILPSEALLGPTRHALGARISSVSRRLQLSRPKEPQNLLKVLTSRGGGDDEDDEDEEEFEDDEEDEQTEGGSSQGLDDDDEDDEELNDAGVNEGDFNDGSFINMVKKEYLRTPPITKGYLWGSVGITALSYVLNGNAWPKWLLLEWQPVFTRLQIWRPLTSFMYLGNLGLNYLLSAHFMWTYMAHLEKLKCKDPADFLIMLVFGAVSLLVASQAIGFPPVYLGHNLSCYLVYIWSRMFEGQDVDVMGLFHLPAHLLPWFFVAQTLVLEQELPVSDLVGIAVGHLYHFLHSSKRLVPPAALRALFARKEVRKLYRKFEDELQ